MNKSSRSTRVKNVLSLQVARERTRQAKAASDRKVMTLTRSVRAMSLCSFPRVANSFACASFVAISALECFLFLAIAACIRSNARRVLARITSLRLT